jgi:hypothetical protein
MKFNIQMGQLAEAVEEYKNIKLEDNQEVDIRDLGCKINTPTGSVLINQIIKKENLTGIKLTLDTGIEVKCAEYHILQQNKSDVYARDLDVGDLIDTDSDPVKIINIEKISDTTFYDISIPYPHLYYDADGILHHNTITTVTLSKLCEPYGRTIVIVPNKSLVEQTEEDYVNCGLDVGVYYGDRKDYSKTHTICTWQSLNILEKRFKEGQSTFSLDEFLDGVNAVIVDEAHGIKAEKLSGILTKSLRNCPIRWGLTGTIPKEEYEFHYLLSSIGPIVGQVTAKELQEKGILAECKVDVLQLLDTQEFRDYQSELKFLTTNEARLEYIAKTIDKIKDTGNTLILVDRIASGERLAELIPNATFVNGSVKSKARKAEYKDINEGHGKVLIATYGVAAVGINIPRIFNLVLIEPGKSFIRVIQSIGRGIRKANDKDFVQIWDVTSTCKYAKRHLTERKKFYTRAQYPFTIKKIDWN